MSDIQLPEPKVGVDANNPERIIVALDATQLDAMQDCLYKFAIRHEENFISEGVSYIEPNGLNDGIKKGKVFHKFLEFYYKARADNASVTKARSDAVSLTRPSFPTCGLEEDMIKMLIFAFLRYTEEYSNENLEVISTERPFSVTLYEDDYLVILWEGIIDLRYRLPAINENQTMDHKTGQRKNYYDEAVNQFLGYAFASGDNVVVVNEIVFTKDPSFHRQPLSYNPLMIERWRVSVIETVQEYLLYRNLGKFPRRFRACNLKYPCPYIKWCKADDTTQKWLLKTDYTPGKKWDPFMRND